MNQHIKKIWGILGFVVIMLTWTHFFQTSEVVSTAYARSKAVANAFWHNTEDTSTQNGIKTTRQKSTTHRKTDVFVPLQDLSSGGKTLSFLHLPKRQAGVSYSEITSANTVTGYPNNPDFTFLVNYSSDHVVLYEDEGVGCVHKIFLVPDSKATALNRQFIVYQVDGEQYRYSLAMFVKGNNWPFLSPLSTQHKIPAMGSYMPICYRKSMKVIYFLYLAVPPDSLDTIVNCTLNDVPCPLRIYSAVSRTKYPIDKRVQSFSEGLGNGYQKRVEEIVQLLENPEDSGPDSGEKCHLTCAVICRECDRVIFKHNSRGLISAIKMRVFDIITNKLRHSWMDILISINFDETSLAQIDKIPLGSLFGATGSLKQFGAATFGKRRKMCAYPELNNAPNNETTGYFYFPMPFWQNIRITLHGTPFMDSDRVLVCHDITVEQHVYRKSHMGYFHAKKSHYTDRVLGNRKVLDVKGAWGQIVGTLFEVDNLRESHNVSDKFLWAPMESDPLIYIDGSKSASVLGTGLEDYLSFAHVFSKAQNATYAFVGNYFAITPRNQPHTWHFYRLHVLDPVYFHDSIQFVMEGMSMDASQPPEHEITYGEHFRRKLAGQGCLSHLVFYYQGTRSGLMATDTIWIGDVHSEEAHHFEIVQSTTTKAGEIFHVTDQGFLATAERYESFSFSGRKFYPTDKFSFTAKTLFSNEGVVLKRTFQSIPRVSWNEKVQIWANGMFVGVWCISKGALSDSFTLREEHFNIAKSATENTYDINVTIEALTVLHDIKYTVFTIV